MKQLTKRTEVESQKVNQDGMVTDYQEKLNNDGPGESINLTLLHHTDV